MLKYRPSGSLSWARTYEEEGKSFFGLGTIAIDDSQNVYACGAAESSSCFTLRIVKYMPDWSAPGSMDTCSSGCSMKSEVTFGYREEAAEVLLA
jgi:hypothetical protein